MNKYLYLIFLLIPGFSFSQETANCNIIWSETVYGGCIGEDRNFLTHDFDNDGIDELISNARLITGSILQGFWFVLKFDPAINEYRKMYSSPIHSRYIYCGSRSYDNEHTYRRNRNL